MSQEIDGLPGLVNAGNEHFKGAEIEARWHFSDDLSVVGTWAWHDARFADYVQDFDGTATQLDGKRLEMSPEHLASVGLIYAPVQGLRAHAPQRACGPSKPWLNITWKPRLSCASRAFSNAFNAASRSR